MSLLDRYLDTEKYQGEIRPLPKALFYQRFGKHELWMTNMDADKAGIDIKKLKFFLFKSLIKKIIMSPVSKNINKALVDLASFDKKGVG